ncbi:MAG: DNA primase [Candidatus Staskawiczbacteria bacterium]|nr:DNA primase [Candidatus Staskawiczbacteria bacterium]
MSDSQIEEIKNKLNVLDIVGNYVKLSKTGINYRGLCPFHSEKGPSFFVSPTRQMWKCFGCGKGGDIFEFIKEIEGVEFGDALRLLANKAGVELKRENPQVVSERKKLYEICDLACSFFEKQLGNSAYGKDAKDYLLKRGIKEESIKKWRLGYSPDTWQGLSDFLVGRGYAREEIVKAGLAVQSEKGNNPYDRFRGRIIFPIFDLNSQVIGFTARVFKDADKKETAKYINTPQTILYDKSNVLYGLNFAKIAVRKNNQCVLTEGQTDTIMCQQAGFENTVAVSGTALTPRHLNILKRYTDNLLLSFDMDVAGDTATKRGINLAESQGFNIKVIDTYSGAKDPAEIILENPENWDKSVKNARTIMDFYFDSTFAKFSAQGGPASGWDKTSSQAKKEIGKIILPAIKRLQNKIEQSHWVQKLSDRLGVSQEAVLEELRNVKTDSGYSDVPRNNGIIEPKKSSAEGRKKLIEDKIVSLVLKNPENLSLIGESCNTLFCNRTKSLIETIRSRALQRGNDPVAIFADMQNSEDKKFLENLSLQADMECDGDGCDEIQLCLLQLKDIELRNKLTELSGAVKQENDEQKRGELIKEFTKNAKELHQKI